jgi:glutaredoxin
MVVIYGKDSCPYTRAARDDYAKRNIPVEYVNVQTSKEALARMLAASSGRRSVPVIVDDSGGVTVGFGGT